nr:protein STICHEL-like 3 [Tanacetum cinerariifolium]
MILENVNNNIGELIDAANLARDIYPGSSDNISKRKGQKDHVKTLSQQLNNVPIDSDSVASSHNRVHERHDSLNKGKRRKFKGRERVPRAAKNEMSMASNFVDEGASHSKQHIEDYGGEQNVTGDPKNGCGIPFNWSRIHDLGKSFLDIGRSFSCGLSDSRSKSGGQRDSSQMPVMSDYSTSSLNGELLPLLMDESQDSVENRSAWVYNYSGELANDTRVGTKISLKSICHEHFVIWPHGTGKTLCARIFARALTCQSLDHLKPYGYFNSCVAHDMWKNRSVREVEWWSAISKVIDRAPRRMVFVLVNSSLDVLPHWYRILTKGQNRSQNGQNQARTGKA